MTKHIDLGALQALAEKAGGDEWSTDTIKNEGEYGAGEDAVCGFDSFAVVDSKGNTLLDTLNFDQSDIHEEYDEDHFRAWDEPAQRVAEFVAAANPQTVSWMIARIRELEGDTGKSAEASPEWVNCESRGPIVRNSLKHQFEDLRGRAVKCRKAYNKDFMRVPFEFIADAYDRAADVIEASYRAAAKTDSAGRAAPEGEDLNWQLREGDPFKGGKP